MKIKITILAIIAAASTAAYAWVKCPQCNGTGWNGNLKCFSCGGDGKIGQ